MTTADYADEDLNWQPLVAADTVEDTYVIPETNLYRLQQKLAELNKRAKRLKVEPVKFEVVQTEVREVKDDITGRKRQRVFHHVKVTGVAPKLNGWTFIATLDFTSATPEDGGPSTLVRTVPGFTLAEHYRCSDATCDHCKTLRRRNETFVVRHDDGRELRVGRQCLADFLGHKNPHMLAAMAQWLAEFRAVAEDAQGESFFGGGGDSRMDLEEFLGYVAAEIRVTGWLSAGVAFQQGRSEDSTKNRALTTKGNQEHPRTRQYVDAKLLANDDDKALVEQAIAWIRGVREAGGELNDYMYSLTVVCASDRLDYRNAGIAASVIPAYKRAQEQELKRRTSLRLSETSQFVGTAPSEAVTVVGGILFEAEGDAGQDGVRQGIVISKKIKLPLLSKVERVAPTHGFTTVCVVDASKVVGRPCTARLYAAAPKVGKIPGDRLTLTLKVLGMHSFQGQYGSVTFVRMTDGTNAFTLKSSTGAEGLEIGGTYEITATVTKHENYSFTDREGNQSKPVKTTYLNRFVIEKTVEEPPK